MRGPRCEWLGESWLHLFTAGDSLGAPGTESVVLSDQGSACIESW
jgi:hypothetical protein